MKSREAFELLFDIQAKIMDIKKRAEGNLEEEMEQVISLIKHAQELINGEENGFANGYEPWNADNLFQQIVENISDAIYITDLKGDFTYICKNVDVVFGYSYNELLQKENIKYILGEDLYSIDKLKTTGEIKNIVRSVPNKQGEMLSLIINIKKVSIGKGELLITCRDITERRKFMQDLVESRIFSEKLLESMKDGFCITDESGLHLDVNNSLCNITEYDKDELVGKRPPYPYWPEEELGNINQAFKKIQKGYKEDIELTFKRKSGERFPVIVSPSQVKNNQGALIANFVTVKDISELKKVEAELEIHKENLEGLVKERTKELEEKNVELENFNKLFVGREFRIKELKDKIRELEGKTEE